MIIESGRSVSIIGKEGIGKKGPLPGPKDTKAKAPAKPAEQNPNVKI